MPTRVLCASPSPSPRRWSLSFDTGIGLASQALGVFSPNRFEKPPSRGRRPSTSDHKRSKSKSNSTPKENGLPPRAGPNIRVGSTGSRNKRFFPTKDGLVDQGLKDHVYPENLFSKRRRTPLFTSSDSKPKAMYEGSTKAKSTYSTGSYKRGKRPRSPYSSPSSDYSSDDSQRVPPHRKKRFAGASFPFETYYYPTGRSNSKTRSTRPRSPSPARYRYQNRGSTTNPIFGESTPTRPSMGTPVSGYYSPAPSSQRDYYAPSRPIIDITPRQYVRFADDEIKSNPLLRHTTTKSGLQRISLRDPKLRKLYWLWT